MKPSTLLKFIAILLFLNPFLALATDASVSNNQYPPYPDIWGYDLSNCQAMNNNDSIISAYKMDNGDYWFEFISSIKRKSPTEKYEVEFIKYSLLKFFEGKAKELNKREENYLTNSVLKGKRVGRYNSKKIIFSNGHTIEMQYKHRAKVCDGETIQEVYFLKKDEKSNELGEYSVIIAMPTVSKVEEWTAKGSIGTCGFPSYDGYIYKQLYLLSGGMIKLEDDTFLLYDDYNIIARFDQNFKTKFNPKVNFKTRDGRILKHNLFVIPYKVVNAIYEEVSDKKLPQIQGLHDGLMDYIIKNYNN